MSKAAPAPLLTCAASGRRPAQTGRVLRIGGRQAHTRRSWWSRQHAARGRGEVSQCARPPRAGLGDDLTACLRRRAGRRRDCLPANAPGRRQTDACGQFKSSGPSAQPPCVRMKLVAWVRSDRRILLHSGAACGREGAGLAALARYGCAVAVAWSRLPGRSTPSCAEASICPPPRARAAEGAESRQYAT
jgi:hypothetical protein